MICKFTFRGKPIFVHAERIAGIMPSIPTSFAEKVKMAPTAVIFCDEPLGAVTVEEGVEEAACIWLCALYSDTVDEEEDDGQE